jgi:hypothetical protein
MFVYSCVVVVVVCLIVCTCMHVGSRWCYCDVILLLRVLMRRVGFVCCVALCVLMAHVCVFCVLLTFCAFLLFAGAC